MTTPELHVYFGYGSTWKSEPGSITWTDETCYVNDRRQMVDVMRGASSAHGKAGTGTVGLTLNNADRRFDPLHSGSPLAGDLLPGVPVKLVAEQDGFPDRPVAYGYVQSWPQRPDGTTYSSVPIDIFDGFKMLARIPMPTSLYDIEVLADSPRGYWKLNDPGQGAMDSSGNGYHGLYRNDPALSDVEMIPGSKAHEFNGGFQSVDIYDNAARIELASTSSAWSIEAVFRTSDTVSDAAYPDPIYVQTGNAGTLIRLAIEDGGKIGVLWTVNGAGLFYESDLSYNDGKVHHVVFARSAVGPVSRLYVDGVQVPGSFPVGGGGPVAYGLALFGDVFGRETPGYWNGLGSHVATYNTTLSGARIAAHYAAATNPWLGDRSGQRIERHLDLIEWPAGLRNIDVGISQLGTATFGSTEKLLSHLQQIEKTEDGRLFMSNSGEPTLHDRYWPFTATEATTTQATFTDVPGGISYADFSYALDDELIINSVTYARRGGAEITVTDQDSIDVYGELGETETDLLMGNDAEVLSRAEWKLINRAEASPRIESILIPLHKYTPAQQDAVLALELGHRVRTIRTPQGVGSAIDLSWHVDGIKHAVGFSEWWVELYVSPAPSPATFAKWGSGVWGAARWAY